MLSEFVETLTRVIESARTPKLIAVPGRGDQVIVSLGGHYETITLAPAPRCHIVNTINDLIAAAEHFPGKAPGAVFHRYGFCELLLDHEDRRDVVRCHLAETPQFALLRKLGDSQHWFTQPQFIRLLRTELEGTGTDSLVPTFRQLDLSRKSDGTRRVEHGDESLGLSVETRVSGRAEIPDGYVLSCPVYQGDAWVAEAIRCHLEIDVQSVRFSLEPVPGEIQRAIESTHRKLHELLLEQLASDGDAFVFRGSSGGS